MSLSDYFKKEKESKAYLVEDVVNRSGVKSIKRIVVETSRQSNPFKSS
jgi:hypothetical protein